MEPRFVSRAKADLWWRLNGSNWSSSRGLGQNMLPGNLAEAEAAIKTRLSAAFEQRVSASLLVVGPEGSGKNYVVESALAALQRENAGEGADEGAGKEDEEDEENDRVSIARVRGLVDSDHHALCYIAYQLCKRGAKDRNIVVALEDLEDHFKQCYLNGTPAVIVLEDIDIFATREKQVLIYTLLDFMHRKDQLLVVIGTTSKAHLPTLLEKRTASRLNAQFVYVPPATGRDVCQVMSRCLTLPIEDARGQGQGQGQGQGEGEGDRPTEESKDVDEEANGDAMDVEGAGGGMSHAEREYRFAFNKVVRHLFGAPAPAVTATTTTTTTTTTKTSGDAVAAGARRKRPALEGCVTAYCEWGKGLEHFLRVAKLAVTSLRCPEGPDSGKQSSSSSSRSTDSSSTSASTTHGPHLLSSSSFERALFSQDPPSLVERLVALPWLELHVFAAVSRLFAQRNGVVLVSSTDASNERRAVGTSVASSSSSSSSGGGGASGVSGASSGSSGDSLSRAAAGRKKENYMTVSMVVSEFDRLTGMVQRNAISEVRVLQALMALATEESLVVLTNGAGKPASTRHVTGRTLVLLVPPYNHVRDAFLPNEGGSRVSAAGNLRAGVNCGFVDQFGDRQIGRAPPRLVITDRVRRAILEPLEVLHVDAGMGP